MAKPTTAPVNTSNAAADDMPDFASWTDRQVTFVPYWHPNQGDKFYGKIVGIDMRNPEFVRLQFQCLQNELKCQRGPVAEGNEVIVRKGENFSMSVYSALADELTFQLQSGISPPTFIEAQKKVKTSSGKDCWQFRCRVSPEDNAKLVALYPAWQKERAGELSGDTRPALEA
jgi:hypothetical protein